MPVMSVGLNCIVIIKRRKSMRLIDLTRQSMGWNNPFRTRTTNQIRTIGIHHSATNVGSQRIFENHWRNLGWRNGGYHEIILQNGDVEICYDPTIVVNGVGDHNMDSYHICVVGSFRPNGTQPNATQMRSLIERIIANMNRFNILVERVLGHNEFANTANFNHRSNTCPGQNMNNLRNQLRTSSSSNTHTVRSGDTLSAIARQHGTTILDLQRTNGITNANLIRVGQILRLPQTTSSNNIRVNSRVRVNQSARIWATGQSIPTWVRGRIYIVRQMRQSNNELLLTDVNSWIRRNDVTLV